MHAVPLVELPEPWHASECCVRSGAFLNSNCRWLAHIGALALEPSRADVMLRLITRPPSQETCRRCCLTPSCLKSSVVGTSTPFILNMKCPSLSFFVQALCLLNNESQFNHSKWVTWFWKRGKQLFSKYSKGIFSCGAAILTRAVLPEDRLLEKRFSFVCITRLSSNVLFPYDYLEECRTKQLYFLLIPPFLAGWWRF